MSNSKTFLLATTAAIAGLAATGVAEDAQAKEGFEKCYGVAKAGENDCASRDGSHGCAGLAKIDNDFNEWKYVPEGDCATLGGTISGAEADDMLKKAAERVKCYGVSKAGENDCASLDGAHGCAGLAKVDNDPNEWQYLPKGTCDELGGAIHDASNGGDKKKKKWFFFF